MPKILSEEVDSILRVSSLELRRRSPVSVAETTSKNELEVIVFKY
jgi:hypothetical protein